MGRYYFHLKQVGGSILRDPEGVELPDLSVAREQALVSARELVADAILTASDLTTLAIIVVDEHGHELNYIPLRAVLPKSLQVHHLN